MRLALISDLHGQRDALEYLNRIVKNYEVDAFIVSGDISQYDDISYLQEIFLLLARSKTNAYMVWGNSDGPRAQKTILNSKYNIHLEQKSIGDHKIIGLGEIDQPIIIEPEKLQGTILVTHRPPLRSLLTKQYNGAPKFHISGHLHTIKNVRKYPSTTTIQVPTLQDGEFALFDPNHEKVKFLNVQSV